jgi:FADH2 O2-dependent halogenase
MPVIDVIIIGSGFAGSIMAMILKRLGKSVVVLEKDRHPRFTIGESSTPLANLLLKDIARKYDLPELALFSKWGSWQKAHPEIACGLKRGFTFYKHEFGSEVDFRDRTQQLLVAASPHDRIADTHWYRPEFDAYLAAHCGATSFEGASGELRQTDHGWHARGESAHGLYDIEGRFLIDASGPRGCLYRHFGFEESREGFARIFPETQAVFAHFRNVNRIDRPEPELPYPVDDAAVHHIFDGGWIWVLRFNNGITSAGAVIKRDVADEIGISEGEAAWERLLHRLPSVAAQFRNAEPATQFYVQPRVAFRLPRAAGPNWAMLPSAAGFVDPLFSTGFALTLLGIERLAEVVHSGTTEKALARYEEATFRELDQAGFLVATAYERFPDFPAFADVSRMYFAAAIWSETLRRLGRKSPEFLFADNSEFVSAVRNLRIARDEVFTRACSQIERYDLAGLLDKGRQNWHPVREEDLFSNAWKIPATREEIQSMLARCEF